MSDKPKIYATCPAGCLWETVHRSEIENQTIVVNEAKHAVRANTADYAVETGVRPLLWDDTESQTQYKISKTGVYLVLFRDTTAGGEDFNTSLIAIGDLKKNARGTSCYSNAFTGAVYYANSDGESGNIKAVANSQNSGIYAVFKVASIEEPVG